MKRRTAAVVLLLGISACNQSGLSTDGGTLADRGVPIDQALAGDLSDGAQPDLAAGAEDLAPPPADLSSSDATRCPPYLNGIWLIGWSGGLDHFSWARFTCTFLGGGTVDFLDPMGNAAWTPYFGCQGQGQWMITQAL